jgi:hypothetical protein
MNRSEEECQPCENFNPGKDYYEQLYNYHQCVRCGEGVVRFCHNCYTDHHEGGYNNCKSSFIGCKYNHPKCLEKLGEVT